MNTAFTVGGYAAWRHDLPKPREGHRRSNLKILKVEKYRVLCEVDRLDMWVDTVYLKPVDNSE